MKIVGGLGDMLWGVRSLIIGELWFPPVGCGGADVLYRFDPSRFILEHYIDGDLVNDETPINRTEAGPDNLHVWGECLPIHRSKESANFEKALIFLQPFYSEDDFNF